MTVLPIEVHLKSLKFFLKGTETATADPRTINHWLGTDSQNPYLQEHAFKLRKKLDFLLNNSGWSAPIQMLISDFIYRSSHDVDVMFLLPSSLTGHCWHWRWEWWSTRLHPLSVHGRHLWWCCCWDKRQWPQIKLPRQRFTRFWDALWNGFWWIL